MACTMPPAAPNTAGPGGGGASTRIGTTYSAGPLITVTNAVPVNLLIENRGEAAMTITSVKVRGDVRCAFKRAQFAPAIGQKIEAGDSFIVRFFYVVPNAVGDDAAAIEIESDAENLPRLVIPVCGKAVTRGTPNDPNQMCPDRTTAEYTECFEEP